MHAARPGAGIGGLAAPALAAALALGGPGVLAAAPVARVAELPASDGIAVLDIRAEDECLDSSLPGARCLPASWLLDNGRGQVSGFHALRWLFGTVGLTGAETLVIYAGTGEPGESAWAVAALAHLAGQAEVFVFGGDAAADESGWPRSFSREAVFVAPMRLDALKVVGRGTGPTPADLAQFARGMTEIVAFAADT